MNSSTATDIVLHILGINGCPKHIRTQLSSFLELISSQPQKKDEKKIKEDANEIKPEENTIDLQTIDHFAMPEEMNVQIEGNEQSHKIKIFPDGVSETTNKEEAVPSTAN
jgi:hypothetical protein